MADVAPIADLSYRNYTGPLDAPQKRWWVIAKLGIWKAIKNKWFWMVMLPAAGYYLAMILVLFVFEQLAASSLNGQKTYEQFLSRMHWPEQFLHGFSFGQIWYCAVALMLGAGAIANDNRANALLVYLSKPCTKADYLFGKWMGVFIPLLAVMLFPALLFYGFGVLSYRGSGFISQDPWLLPRLLILLPLGAAFETSLVLGVSSLFRQGQIAAASYAALYFITNFFTHFVAGIITFNYQEASHSVPPVVTSMFYASVDGVQIGLAKGILKTDGGQPFGFPNPQSHTVPGPNLAATVGVAIFFSLVAIWIAWKRVRAVEVVR